MNTIKHASIIHRKNPYQLIIRECTSPKQTSDCIRLMNTGLSGKDHYKVLPISEEICDQDYYPLPDNTTQLELPLC